MVTTNGIDFIHENNARLRKSIDFNTTTNGSTKSRATPSVLAMAAKFGNLKSKAGLKSLDNYLLTRSYITVYQASKDDITVLASLSFPPSLEYVYASRWYNHIDALLRIFGVSRKGNGVTIEGFTPVDEEVVATPAGVDTSVIADKDDDDNVDLFGEETEEKKKVAEERAAAVKASKKKKESRKSSILLDVKPWDDETDMKKLEKTMRSIQMEGLTWGAYKLVIGGYGIKKMIWKIANTGRCLGPPSW